MKFIKPLKAFGIVTVKKSAIAPKTFDAASFTASHTAMTLFLKSSLVAKSVTNAATSAATTVITMPIGLAAITVFKIFCAMVTPSVVAFHTFIAGIAAGMLAWNVVTMIQGLVAAIIEIICVPFLDIKEIKSFTLLTTASTSVLTSGIFPFTSLITSLITGFSSSPIGFTRSVLRFLPNSSI